MELTDCPRPAPEAVLYTDFDGMPLLFHPLFGEVVALPPVALATWRAIDGRRSVAEIASLVQAQCEDAPPDIAADIAAFLDDLRRRGFVALEDPRLPADGNGWLRTAPGGQDLAGPQRADGGATYNAASPACHGKPETAVSLALADGSRFHLVALDEPAGRILAQFAAAASLPLASGSDGGQRLYLATTDSEDRQSQPRPGLAGDERVFYIEPRGVRRPARLTGRGAASPAAQSPPGEDEWLWLQLVRLSAFLGQQLQPRGGLLLHSALALAPLPSPLSPACGILLAGRSGVGKSTASRRLPLPWRSLADDVTLVVRDGDGSYWAHPWPTWSRIYEKHLDDRWNLQEAVPLRAICILEQGHTDRIQPAQPAEALVLLMELARQASQRWLPGYAGMDTLACFHQQRFENACALARKIPVYLLDVTLEGEFWREIEKVIIP